ncbi:hypothetical protein C8R45DRAFT_1076740 [Mycena sanguinolenta]|nr:hypothetical protein C8R45DRAFT_1076740 [Mycena sanguinolenta]
MPTAVERRENEWKEESDAARAFQEGINKACNAHVGRVEYNPPPPPTVFLPPPIPPPLSADSHSSCSALLLPPPFYTLRHLPASASRDDGTASFSRQRGYCQLAVCVPPGPSPSPRARPSPKRAGAMHRRLRSSNGCRAPDRDAPGARTRSGGTQEAAGADGELAVHRRTPLYPTPPPLALPLSRSSTSLVLAASASSDLALALAHTRGPLLSAPKDLDLGPPEKQTSREVDDAESSADTFAHEHKAQHAITIAKGARDDGARKRKNENRERVCSARTPPCSFATGSKNLADEMDQDPIKKERVRRRRTHLHCCNIPTRSRPHPFLPTSPKAPPHTRSNAIRKRRQPTPTESTSRSRQRQEVRGQEGGGDVPRGTESAQRQHNGVHKAHTACLAEGGRGRRRGTTGHEENESIGRAETKTGKGIETELQLLHQRRGPTASKSQRHPKTFDTLWWSGASATADINGSVLEHRHICLLRQTAISRDTVLLVR